MENETMQNQEQELFNLNDPRLDDYIPEGFDPEADLPTRGFRPPNDGKGWVRLFMRQPKEDKPNPYTKGTPTDASTIVATRPRIEKEDGSLGAFLADAYFTTKVRGKDPTSSMHMMAKQAGVKLPVGLPSGEIRKRVREAFEVAGEAGLRVYGTWKMKREIPKLNELGEEMLNDNGYPEVTTVWGRTAVIGRNLRDAEELAAAQVHMSDDEKGSMVAAVGEEPWKYYALKDGSYELREARVVFELQAPPKG